ncbi:uncharacterized protein HHUB_6101 (plasmid) [Halobacterium hubeiense]|uniref:Uncharacterized protein n=1 Tax=Halobacterium hubeiense TaxID=1407499 RepID=A0A0U5HZF7_9EURY|nr:hypothetical protein [Halobacterium hubeiense]CQH65332.1 uncharacterized protein HHUB_6101 [Halobacterium hubeiense]
MGSKIPEEKLVADLQAVADMVGEAPTVAQYRAHGEYSYAPLKNHFGSYNDAIEAAGLKPNQQVADPDCQISTEALITDIQAVAEHIGETPTQLQYRKYGEHASNTLVRAFGSYNDALEAAGYKPNRHRDISKDELLSNLRQIASDLNEVPTAHQFSEYGKYSLDLLTDEFGSYNNALKAAGFEVNTYYSIPAEDLLIDLVEVADKLGETPTKDQYSEFGIYHGDTLTHQFGSFAAALEEIGHEPNRKQPITDTELLLDVQRVAEEVGGPPTYEQYNTHGEYSSNSLKYHFGSYNNAIRTAGFEPVRECNVADDVLLTDLQNVVDELEEIPTSRQYDEHGEFHSGTLHRRFGGYNSAIKAAGYEPTVYRDIADTELLADIRETADEQGNAPTSPEYTERGTYTARTVIQRFGTWSDAVEAAGCDPPCYNHYSDEQLLTELQRLADGRRAPTQREMAISGKYSPQVYRDRFGWWWQACVRANLVPHTRVPLRKQEYADFVEAAIQQKNPVTSIIGLLAAFTGLTQPLLGEFSTEWLDRLHSDKRDTLIIVPSEHLETTDDWVLRLPIKWHPPDSSGAEDLPLEGLLKWHQESQIVTLDQINAGGIKTRVRTIAEAARIDHHGIISNLRSSLAAHLIRQGAELWKAEMQVGFKHTNWGASEKIGIGDYLLWVYQMEGAPHHEYEPEGVFLDPPEDHYAPTR